MSWLNTVWCFFNCAPFLKKCCLALWTRTVFWFILILTSHHEKQYGFEYTNEHSASPLSVTRDRLFLLQLGKILWKASVLRYEFFFNEFQSLSSQNCYLCLHCKTNVIFWGDSAPSVPGVVTLFEKVRGSYWKTGSCPCAVRAWENFNSRK